MYMYLTKLAPAHCTNESGRSCPHCCPARAYGSLQSIDGGFHHVRFWHFRVFQFPYLSRMDRHAAPLHWEKCFKRRQKMRKIFLATKGHRPFWHASLRGRHCCAWLEILCTWMCQDSWFCSACRRSWSTQIFWKWFTMQRNCNAIHAVWRGPLVHLRSRVSKYQLLYCIGLLLLFSGFSQAGPKLPKLEFRIMKPFRHWCSKRWTSGYQNQF